jgi:hypothetical protein
MRGWTASGWTTSGGVAIPLTSLNCWGVFFSEHVGVYVYNPGCWENGALPFDVVRGGSSCPMVVQPDSCPPVHTIGVADMRGAETVLLTERKGGERVRLCFFLRQ